ncbi:MAG: tRNA pseudouridine(38-40) synthase TruA [Lachnospiraceae bacterium]|nr:tRNA pseudouridine(38-40) synthase TruA [Lachnospiraceae bacterium]
MKRVLMCVSYDGTAYSGWQVQDNARTIEGELNKALTDLTGTPTEVIGASRTDAGVHSLASMCVFDTEMRMPADKYSFALNTRLPEDIRVVWSREVAPDFHPRHTDTVKTYEYHIYNADFCPPTKRLYAYHERRPLDTALMQEGAAYLIGEHDFKSFCSVNTNAETTVRTILDIKVAQESDEVVISVTGTGFLYNQVRIIAGTLMWVGLGIRKPSDVKDMLEALDREAAGPTAPAHGLLLKEFSFVNLP